MAGDKMMYQIKVTLNGIRPPVWRRLLVSSSLSLRDLHDILQVAIGWTDSHLHQFVAKGTFYGEPDPEFGMERLDETRVRVDEVLRKEKDAITYEHDFGDGNTRLSWKRYSRIPKLVSRRLASREQERVLRRTAVVSGATRTC